MNWTVASMILLCDELDGHIYTNCIVYLVLSLKNVCVLCTVTQFCSRTKSTLVRSFDLFNICVRFSIQIKEYNLSKKFSWKKLSIQTWNTGWFMCCKQKKKKHSKETKTQVIRTKSQQLKWNVAQPNSYNYTVFAQLNTAGAHKSNI